MFPLWGFSSQGLFEGVPVGAEGVPLALGHRAARRGTAEVGVAEVIGGAGVIVVMAG